MARPKKETQEANEELKRQIVALLKHAGKDGIKRQEIIETLHISNAKLANIINANSTLPIGYDYKIDDCLYWAGCDNE